MRRFKFKVDVMFTDKIILYSRTSWFTWKVIGEYKSLELLLLDLKRLLIP